MKRRLRPLRRAGPRNLKSSHPNTYPRIECRFVLYHRHRGPSHGGGDDRGYRARYASNRARPEAMPHGSPISLLIPWSGARRRSRKCNGPWPSTGRPRVLRWL